MTPRWHAPSVAVFEAVFSPFTAFCLRIRLRADDSIDPGRGVVFVANHHSWWDGFLLRALQRRLMPNTPLWSVMLERELAPRGWFRRMGCLGVAPGEPGSIRSLVRNLGAIARSPGGWAVSYFPQGRIRPADARPLGFRPGLERILSVMGNVQVVPVALRIEPLNTRRPHAFVWAGAPLEKTAGERFDLSSLERAVERQLDSLEAELARLGEDASREWPGELA
ncbi:MAG TPA: lysophospholipid acyltransferase family protein [Fibrobacteria bacterium]|nr:lysophospholipid acyltransferase family protein [Fibrobacteria bacterium]